MCNINWIDEDLKYIWHPCSQMKDYEELKPIVIDHGKVLIFMISMAKNISTSSAHGGAIS